MIDEKRLPNVDYLKMYRIIIDCHKTTSRRAGLDLDSDLPLTNFQYLAELGQYFEPIWPHYFAMLYAYCKCRNEGLNSIPAFSKDIMIVINTVVTDPTIYVPVLVNTLEKSLHTYNQFESMVEFVRKYTGYIKYLKELLV